MSLPTYHSHISNALTNASQRLAPYAVLFARLHHLQHTIQQNEAVTDDAVRLADIERGSQKW
jgi:hypothetical protein